jgi:hypothetical protein
MLFSRVAKDTVPAHYTAFAFFFSVAALVNETKAEYVGLATSLHTNVTIGGTARYVYRVYAAFSNVQDYLISTNDSGQMGNIVIQNRNSNDTALGTGFHNNFSNHSNGGLTAPSQRDVDSMPASRWDTFVTIGVDLADPNGLGDQTVLSPNFAQNMGNLFGPAIESNNASWFVPGPTEQGRAGHWANNRVMIMQLTVNAGQNVRGTVRITGINADGSEFTAYNQTFNSFPAPPALAMFVGPALIPLGRRRRT